MDNDQLVTKAQAAERLGISERAVARRAEAGLLQPIYQPREGGGSRVYYSAAEVEALRDELAQPRERRATRALARVESVASLVEVVQAIRQLMPAQALPPAPAPELRATAKAPLVVSLKQAAAITGLSRGTIASAIAEGRLDARPYGPGGALVVRRADALALVAQLWAEPAPEVESKPPEPKRRGR